ncbi:unnamed protein product, partial [Symbiodinium natans]
MKIVSHKFRVGMDAVKSKYPGIDFAEVYQDFQTGILDNIIMHTTQPEVAAPAWSFVRKCVAAANLNQQNMHIQAAEEAAREACAVFKRKESQKDDVGALLLAGMQAYKADLKAYFLKMKALMERRDADMTQLTARKLDGLQQALSRQKGSILSAVPSSSVATLGSSEGDSVCVVVTSAATRDLTVDLLTSLVAASEPKGCVVVCLPPAWHPEARKAELIIAETMMKTAATKLPLQLKQLGALSSAVVLLNHEKQDVAEQASELLKMLLSSTAMRTGALNLTAAEEEKQVLELLEGLNVLRAGKMLAVLDMRGRFALNLARLLLPAPLKCISDNADLRNSLEALEKSKLQKRILIKTDSDFALDTIAAQLPTTPEVPEILAAMAVSTGKADYQNHIILEASNAKPSSAGQTSSSEMSPNMFLPACLAQSQACIRHDVCLANSLAVPNEKGLFAMRKFEKGDVIMVLP